MTKDDLQPNLDRDQTDESLRAERSKADAAIGQNLTGIEEAADAVIEKARAHADAVLSAARRKTDRQLPSGAAGAEPRKTLERERLKEDATLERERGAADEVLREERAEHAAILEGEREETDKNLSLERARADAAVATRDELLGIVSHDLRNMLGAVLGFGSLIAKVELDDDHRDRVLVLAERIRRSGTRMNRLIGDLVDLASIEAGCLAVAREPCDPGLVIVEVADTFRGEASSRGLSLITDVDATLPHAFFDSARILQVLVNLVTNAIKFTPKGGTVLVRLEPIDGDLKFSVSDTGVGIPEDKLGGIFERYRQLDPSDHRGVGLGLYISQCIVQGHGGKIGVESRLGKGSTFFFIIPGAIATDASAGPLRDA